MVETSSKQFVEYAFQVLGVITLTDFKNAVSLVSANLPSSFLGAAIVFIGKYSMVGDEQSLVEFIRVCVCIFLVFFRVVLLAYFD